MSAGSWRREMQEARGVDNACAPCHSGRGGLKQLLPVQSGHIRRLITPHARQLHRPVPKRCLLSDWKRHVHTVRAGFVPARQRPSAVLQVRGGLLPRCIRQDRLQALPRWPLWSIGGVNRTFALRNEPLRRRGRPVRVQSLPNARIDQLRGSEQQQGVPLRHGVLRGPRSASLQRLPSASGHRPGGSAQRGRLPV